MHDFVVLAISAEVMVVMRFLTQPLKVNEQSLLELRMPVVSDPFNAKMQLLVASLDTSKVTVPAPLIVMLF